MACRSVYRVTLRRDSQDEATIQQVPPPPRFAHVDKAPGSITRYSGGLGGRRLLGLPIKHD
jgi:hypothetical protein